MEKSITQGLTQKEAEKRLNQEGLNCLHRDPDKGIIRRFLQQLMDPLIYVLLGAGVISIFLGEMADGIIVFSVVLVNAFVGMLQEGKAKKALEALENLSRPKAIVIRDGVKQEITAQELVRGDLVFLEAGNQVPADMVLTEAVELRVEESALTGETIPVLKQADVSQIAEPFLLEHCSEQQKQCRVFMSTVVLNGHGLGIVTATGMHTEIGHIARMISDAGEEFTPLQKRLGDLGKVLSILSLVLCAALFVLAIYQKRNVYEMFLVAISLAVAAVPEGMPAVVTICLALAVTRMAKVHAIIRRLPSVETLGCVSVVCSDKTGTLTCNRMKVEQSYLPDTTGQEDFWRGLILCNDSDDHNGLGDPTELALLCAGREKLGDPERIRSEYERKGEIPFDSDRKCMTTFHLDRQGRGISYTKGAPDILLEKCSDIWENGRTRPMKPEDRKRIQEAVEKMAGEALRTIAVGMYRGAWGCVEDQLTFLGIAGMCDPIRPEAVEAVSEFRQAGVKTVMITGDYQETAVAVAGKLGIASGKSQCITGRQLRKYDKDQLIQEIRERDVTVFARVTPSQKVQIVKAFQEGKGIVAMTGDGVNDAPALKCADIGIAMGQKGTDVARQAADMVLADDNFATIEKAIEEGRSIYENIRKSVVFLLSSNLGEILTMFLAIVFGLMSPLKSSHILWINLITDSLPALALGIDQNDKRELMRNSPRKSTESLFARGGLACTCFYGILIGAISLAAFLFLPVQLLRTEGVPLSLEAVRGILEQPAILVRSQTYAFTVLAISQLFHAIGMRDTAKSLFRMNHLENKWMLMAFILGFILQLSVTKLPGLVRAFGCVQLQFEEWIFLLILSAFPLVAHEILVFCNFVKLRIHDL